MPTDHADPLDGVTPETVKADEVDHTVIRDAFTSSNPLERQRGVKICETLASEDVDTVKPFLDDIATIANDSNAAIALRAISILDTVAESDPGLLDGRLDALVETADSEIVDVQLTGATVLGKLVVQRSDLVAPYTHDLVIGLLMTEPEPETSDVSDFVDDQVTRQTIEEHERGERRRRTAARRTLANVVVAVTEEEPGTVLEAAPLSTIVDDLVSLLDDVDAQVVGGAVDALGQLALADAVDVALVRDPLRDCLNHNQKVVRARAVRAYGRIGDDAVIPALRTVASTDPDEDIQEVAEETATFLAGKGET